MGKIAGSTRGFEIKMFPNGQWDAAKKDNILVSELKISSFQFHSYCGCIIDWINPMTITSPLSWQRYNFIMFVIMIYCLMQMRDRIYVWKQRLIDS